MASPANTTQSTVNTASNTRSTFISSGNLPPFLNPPKSGQKVEDGYPVNALGLTVSNLEVNKVVKFNWMVGYDESTSIKYYGTEMAPYWKQLLGCDGDLKKLMATLYNESPTLLRYISDYNQALWDDLSAGDNNYGEEYAQMTSLAYRQVTGGINVVYNPIIEEPWVFLKEFSSKGYGSMVRIGEFLSAPNEEVLPRIATLLSSVSFLCFSLSQ